MFAIVIDKQGYKVAFVVLNEDKTTQYYELKDGESMVEEGWQVANGMNKPQWNGKEWIDTDPLPPIEPPIPPVDKTDILQQEVDQLKQINAGLLFDSASSKIEMDKQKQTDANMLLEIALLKGGL